MGVYRRARRCLTTNTPADIQSAGFDGALDMACLTNYTIGCRDTGSGKTGCFLFDVEHWQRTGEFVAVSAVFDSLDALYAGTSREDRRAIYAERLA